MQRQTKIILFSGLALTSVTYLVYNNIRRNQIFTELVAIINKNSVKGSGRTQKVLNGEFHDEVARQNPSKGIIMLSDASLRKIAIEIHDAIDGWGTKESSLKSVISKIKDKFAFSQVASYYSGLYKETLNDALRTDLSEDDMIDTVIIPINEKIDVRWQ